MSLAAFIFVPARGGQQATHAFHARTATIGAPDAFGHDCVLPVIDLLHRPGVDGEITPEENRANALVLLLQRLAEDTTDGGFEDVLRACQTRLGEYLEHGGLYDGSRLQVTDPWPTHDSRLRPLREHNAEVQANLRGDYDRSIHAANLLLEDTHADEIRDAEAGHP
jgi:hypothetical protein